MTIKTDEMYLYYKGICAMKYEDLVEQLNLKYGEVKNDYFKLGPYERFINLEIKNIKKNKISRTSEGLYCHHVKENEASNLSNPKKLFTNKFDFIYQKKENLVYCDLVEHFIMHMLIAKETQGSYGTEGGLSIFGQLKRWIIHNNEPSDLWMKQCKNVIELSSQQTMDIINTLRVDSDIMEIENFEKIFRVLDSI